MVRSDFVVEPWGDHNGGEGGTVPSLSVHVLRAQTRSLLRVGLFRWNEELTQPHQGECPVSALMTGWATGVGLGHGNHLDLRYRGERGAG